MHVVSNMVSGGVWIRISTGSKWDFCFLHSLLVVVEYWLVIAVQAGYLNLGMFVEATFKRVMSGSCSSFFFIFFYLVIVVLLLL